MFITCDLCVKRSVSAAVKTGSWKISCHFKNDRLLVIMVDFLPARNDRCENNNSAPSLSNEIYPNSSRITKSYFSNFNSNDRSVLSERCSFNWLINEGTVAKNTL